jgi:DNA polymerase-3 subunit delta
MISLLVGKDTYAIRAKIATFKKQLDEVWHLFNFHQFPSSNISDAVHCALTPAFGTSKAKLVVVEDCDFKQFTPEMFATLQLLTQVPASTHLVLWGTSIDKRLKVVKFLLGCAKLFEFELIPPWRTDLIAADIGTLATQLKLSLDRKTILYLAKAIGNDSARVESELQKLLTYSGGNRVSLAQVQNLVPSTTHNSLQVAEAIRESSYLKAATLLEELLAVDNFPVAICATLITQFRTWLWVKSTIQSGVKQDAEIAKICNIGNPKRIYFLKQEVQHTSVAALSQALRLLLDLELSLKSGRRKEHMLPSVLAVAKLFE